MSSIVIATVGNDDGPPDSLTEESRRLQHLLRLASDDSILKARDLGLQVMPGGYRFVELQLDRGGIPGVAATQWAVLDSPPFQPRELSTGLRLELFQQGQAIPPIVLAEDQGDDHGSDASPQILLASDGLTTASELHIKHKDSGHSMLLNLQIDGQIRRDHVEPQ